jgi:hypothetical protein
MDFYVVRKWILWFQMDKKTYYSHLEKTGFSIQRCSCELQYVLYKIHTYVICHIPNIEELEPGSWHYHGWLAMFGVLPSAGGEWLGRCDLWFVLCWAVRSAFLAASWLHFQMLLYSKCTQPTVMTEITHGGQGPALHVNSPLVTARDTY